MLQPLRQWYCDVCGGVIEKPDDGYVVRDSDDHGLYHGYNVIHQSRCDVHDLPCSSALPGFLGVDGLAKLLSWLSQGVIIRQRHGEPTRQLPADMDEYVDLFRRMQVPHCEDARQRYLDPRNLEKWTGVNEIYPYLGEVVREIAAVKLDSI